MQFGYTLFYVDDVERSIAFYERAFGLKRKFIYEDEYGELDTGAAKLGFVAHKLAKSNGLTYHEPQPDGPAPPVEIAFLTTDVQGAYEHAVAAGATAVAAPQQKPWGQTIAYVRDPNGFLVELCTPMDG